MAVRRRRRNGLLVMKKMMSKVAALQAWRRSDFLHFNPFQDSRKTLTLGGSLLPRKAIPARILYLCDGCLPSFAELLKCQWYIKEECCIRTEKPSGIAILASYCPHLSIDTNVVRLDRIMHIPTTTILTVHKHGQHNYDCEF